MQPRSPLPHSAPNRAGDSPGEEQSGWRHLLQSRERGRRSPSAGQLLSPRGGDGPRWLWYIVQPASLWYRGQHARRYPERHSGWYPMWYSVWYSMWYTCWHARWDSYRHPGRYTTRYPGRYSHGYSGGVDAVRIRPGWQTEVSRPLRQRRLQWSGSAASWLCRPGLRLAPLLGPGLLGAAAC